jgi:hypothetical protein
MVLSVATNGWTLEALFTPRNRVAANIPPNTLNKFIWSDLQPKIFNSSRL